MPVNNESKFSEWTLTVKRNDNSVWDVMKYLGKIVFGANDTKIRTINWLAERINSVKRGGALANDDFNNLRSLLGDKSVTVSGCAVDLFALAYQKQPEKARGSLMDVLATGLTPARMAAAEALAKAGDVSNAPDICRILPELNAAERRETMKMVETLIKNSGRRPDMDAILKELKEGSARLRAKGEKAQEEFRKYYFRMMDAARMAGIDHKIMKRKNHAEPHRKKRAKLHLVKQKAAC